MNTKKTARLAGFIYLLVILFGVFAEFFVRAKLIDFQQPHLTLTQIRQNQFLFRLGFVSDLLMQTAYFFLPLLLFLLLSKFSRSAAALMVLSVVVAVAIMCVNMLNHYVPLMLLDSPALSGMEAPYLLSQLMMHLEMHDKGYHIAQIFFGIWLFPLGYLVYKSGMIPRVIGFFLMLGCFAYLTDFIIYFLFPEISPSLTSWVTMPADLGEFSLCLYLLIKGVSSKYSSTPETVAELQSV